MSKRVSPMPGQLYAEVTKWSSSDGSDPSHPDRVITGDVEKANVITSMVEENVLHHKLIIDLDLPAKLVPSTTEGHFHLYIDHEIPKDTYFKLLEAMVEAGLVEEGYLNAAAERGYTAVRLPWIKKERQPGEHAWESGAKTCSCGHRVKAHNSENRDDPLTPWVTCDGCISEGSA